MRDNTICKIFYVISIAIIVIQIVLGIINSFFHGEFFDFTLYDQIVLFIHIIQLIINIIYLVKRKCQPEKWMTIINLAVSLITFDFGRAFFALIDVWAFFKKY